MPLAYWRFPRAGPSTLPSWRLIIKFRVLLNIVECLPGLKVAYLSGVQAEDPLTAKAFNYTVLNVQSLEVGPDIYSCSSCYLRNVSCQGAVVFRAAWSGTAPSSRGWTSSSPATGPRESATGLRLDHSWTILVGLVLLAVFHISAGWGGGYFIGFLCV
jgi:hypothetical protein